MAIGRLLGGVIGGGLGRGALSSRQAQQLMKNQMLRGQSGSMSLWPIIGVPQPTSNWSAIEELQSEVDDWLEDVIL